MNLNVFRSNAESVETSAFKLERLRNQEEASGTRVGIAITLVSFQFNFDIRSAASRQYRHSGSKKNRKIFPSSRENGLPFTVMLSGAFSPVLISHDAAAKIAIKPRINVVSNCPRFSPVHQPASPCTVLA